MTKVTEGTIITFYSYKGGVGRTLALANVGALLSRWGYRVLCVDWDLEAPGLHLYFQKWVSLSSFSEQQGLTELIQAYIDNEEIDWKSFVTQIELPNSQYPLSLMIAGSQNKSYIKRMQTLQWDELYETKKLGNFLETLRNEWKAEFDFILIDSRTGVTDSGGICTVQMPDYLCLLFTANNQSLYGAVNIVDRARQTRNHLPFDRGKLWVLPVATRFEARIEYELAQEWLSTFEKELSPLYAEWIHKDISPSSLLNFTKVPYIPYWSFGEKISVLEEETKDSENIGFSFETITAILALKFARSDLLIHNRDAYINAAIKSQYQRPYVLGKIIKIFLVHSSELEDDCKEFEIFINRENKKYIKYGVFLELVSWADFFGAISPIRSQDQYNKIVSDSDIFVALFHYKVEKYSEKELLKALKAFKKNGKPLVFTYFKDGAINPNNIKKDEILSLFDFKKKLRELGHFSNNYSDINDLKLQFSNQLTKLLPKLTDI